MEKKAFSRREFLHLSVATTAGALLAGCVAPMPQAGPVTGGAETAQELEDVEIAYWSWSIGSEAGLQELADAMERLREVYPTLRVETLFVPHGEFLTKLSTAYAGDVAPDVIHLDNQWQGFFGSNNLFVDQMPFAERDDDFPLDDLYEPAVEMFQWEGQQMGWPWNLNTAHVKYNVDLFEEAGHVTPLELYENDEWTWDTFLQVAQDMTRTDSTGRVTQYGTSLRGPYALYLWSNGADHFDDFARPTRSLYDLPEAIEGFQFRADLRHVHNVASLGGEVGGLNDSQAFNNGLIAMETHWGHNLDRHLPAHYGVVPFPKGPSDKGQYACDLTSSCETILPSTERQEESWWLCKWFITHWQVDNAMSANPELPARKSLVAEVQGKLSSTPEVQEVLIQNGFYRPVNVDWPEMNSTIIAPALDELWLGNETADQVCPRLANALNEFLAANPQ